MYIADHDIPMASSLWYSTTRAQHGQDVDGIKMECSWKDRMDDYGGAGIPDCSLLLLCNS